MYKVCKFHFILSRKIEILKQELRPHCVKLAFVFVKRQDSVCLSYISWNLLSPLSLFLAPLYVRTLHTFIHLIFWRRRSLCYMAEPPSTTAGKDRIFLKGAFAVTGIMSTLVIYGLLQVIFHSLFLIIFIVDLHYFS